MSRTLFLIAGEPSGDRLGAALMAGLKQISPQDITFHGIGGPLMQAEGLVPLFPMEELSVIGLTEILANLPRLLKRVRETADHIIATQPDALITIDIPEFSLRVAAKVKACAPRMRTIHYVAPTVWAWRPKRAAKMAKSIDHVLALLPFEPPYMEAAGMSCDFVGHPVATEQQAREADALAWRARVGIAPDAPLIMVLPGSRRSEVKTLSATFGEALGQVLNDIPHARVVLPAAPAVAALVEDSTRNWPGGPLILDPRGVPPEAFAADKRAAFTAADVALAASGTVSLELAASATPMVIAYDMSWLSRTLISSLLKVDTVTLVNLVSDTRVVPEYLGQACKPAAIAGALAGLLTDGRLRGAQLEAAELTMTRLGRDGEAPGVRAARSVLAVL